MPGRQPGVGAQGPERGYWLTCHPRGVRTADGAPVPTDLHPGSSPLLIKETEGGGLGSVFREVLRESG